MKGRYKFRKPLLIDKTGDLYITESQLQFFLNRRKGEEKFRTRHPEFVSYYKNCCLYNVVYDMMEANEKWARMYWDENTQSVAVAFPIRGRVAMALSEVAALFAISDGEYTGEEEDPFGIFS